jgi:hypothetical protein
MTRPNYLDLLVIPPCHPSNPKEGKGKEEDEDDEE